MIPQGAALPLSFLKEEEAYFEFMRCNRDLLFGFFADCPIGDKAVMRQAFINAKQIPNERHEEQIRDRIRLFEAVEADALRQKDPEAYKDRRFRVEFEEEAKCLQQELESRYPGQDCGYVRLKEDDATYANRWLQVFLNGLHGQYHQNDVTEILGADDEALCKANICCDDDRSGGRSALGRFAMEVSSLIKNRRNAILQDAGISLEAGELHKHKEALSVLAADSRNIVWINSLYDVLTNFNNAVSGGTIKQLSILLAAKQTEMATSGIMRPHTCKGTFSRYKALFLSRISKDRVPKQFRERSYKNETLDLIQTYTRTFFLECELLATSLSDFLTLLEIDCIQMPLENEFSQLTVSPRPSLRKSTGQASPRGLSVRGTLASSQSKFVPLSPRSSPRSAEVIQELTKKRREYFEILKTTCEVFSSIKPKSLQEGI